MIDRRRKAQGLRTRCMVTLAAALLFTHPALAETITLGDGLIVDDASGSVVIMRPKGGIAVLDLAQGTERWRSARADRPVLADDGRLLAQVSQSGVGTARFAVLRMADGAVVDTTSLALPEGVRASIDDRLHSRFRVQHDATRPAGDLTWQYNERLVQGAAADEMTPPARVEKGALSADLATAKIRAVEVEVEVQDLQRAPLLLDNPLVGGTGRQFYSADRKNVLRSARLIDGELRYRWDIYSIDKQHLGGFEAPLSYTPFVVRGDRVVFVTQPRVVATGTGTRSEPLTLQAMSLEHGKSAWRTAIRDTLYHGPFPP